MSDVKQLVVGVSLATFDHGDDRPTSSYKYKGNYPVGVADLLVVGGTWKLGEEEYSVYAIDTEEGCAKAIRLDAHKLFCVTLFKHVEGKTWHKYLASCSVIELS